MPPLSELLRGSRSPVSARLPAEPTAVLRSAQRISSRWGHVEVGVIEADPELLVKDMVRRRSTGDWRDFCWADATRTMRALIDSKLWREERFDELLRFLVAQVGPGVNRPFIRTMFRKYLDTFDPESKLTRGLAPVLKENWTEADLRIGPLVHRLRIFDLDTSPPQTIAAHMDSQDEPFHALREAGMEAPHGPGLMAAAHLRFVSRLAPRIENGDAESARKLLDWLNPTSERKSLQGPGAVKAIETLLLPWIQNDPSPSLKELVEGRLIGAYDDPRIQSTGDWPAVSDDARGVILKWLAGATIRVFFDIVTKAERSHMWADRRELWIDLYKRDNITQAWFALSKTGEDIAQRLVRERDGTSLRFGRNDSWSSQDRQKCLLLMSVNGRWVVEGSHNFPTWVFPPGKLLSWKPYEDSYTCDQFRNIRGPEQPERIPHLPNWRNRILTAIQK